MKTSKPLGHKAYGSIGHLPQSKLGPSDHSVHPGQAKICLDQARDKHDRIIVTEKLDGSCCSVALINGEIVPLTRAGYHAKTSPYEQHWLFADWVKTQNRFFRLMLKEGERVVGEWMAQAHGTIYDFSYLAGCYMPFGVFDIMRGHDRVPFDELKDRASNYFEMPTIIHDGVPIDLNSAMSIHAKHHWPCEGEDIEGLVYRVERHGKFDFMAKFVRKSKEPGKYLPEISGKPAVWNWRPKE